ncbi:MAG: TetR/AcrR family transcriptional regulator [Lachnospiraceae bacterium]|nr:TetR/AcrR family transcriptional regulator [Lachnospiraceae bacterium]
MPTRVFTEEEKSQIKLTMLEAGFPLLKKYGMTHTTISKITEAAGIAKGTFYHFWKNKEKYMADLILYHRQKMIPVLISEDVLNGKRKLGEEDARKYLHAVVDEEISIYPHLTLEDEAKLFKNTDTFEPDIEKESAITGELLRHLDNVRKDVSLPLIANMTKLLVIASESREELHEAVYKETIDTLVDTILNLIFERG